MATAGDIIIGALKMARIFDPAETPGNEEMSYNLYRLNLLLDLWSVKRLSVYVRVEDNVAMVIGTRSYTIGSGGDWNTVRPIRIEDAFIRINGYDYPVGTDMTEKEHNEISLKNIQSQPRRLYYKPEYPLGVVYFDYTPDVAYDTYLYSWKKHTAFPDLTTTFSFPEGYEIAITSNLAKKLAADYGRPAPDETIMEAKESLDIIQSVNLELPDTDFSDMPTSGTGGGSSIYSPRI